MTGRNNPLREVRMLKSHPRVLFFLSVCFQQILKIHRTFHRLLGIFPTAMPRYQSSFLSGPMNLAPTTYDFNSGPLLHEASREVLLNVGAGHTAPATRPPGALTTLTQEALVSSAAWPCLPFYSSHCPLSSLTLFQPWAFQIHKSWSWLLCIFSSCCVYYFLPFSTLFTSYFFLKTSLGMNAAKCYLLVSYPYQRRVQMDRI